MTPMRPQWRVTLDLRLIVGLVAMIPGFGLVIAGMADPAPMLVTTGPRSAAMIPSPAMMRDVNGGGVLPSRNMASSSGKRDLAGWGNSLKARTTTEVTSAGTRPRGKSRTEMSEGATNRGHAQNDPQRYLAYRARTRDDPRAYLTEMAHLARTGRPTRESSSTRGP